MKRKEIDRLRSEVSYLRHELSLTNRKVSGLSASLQAWEDAKAQERFEDEATRHAAQGAKARANQIALGVGPAALIKWAENIQGLDEAEKAVEAAIKDAEEEDRLVRLQEIELQNWQETHYRQSNPYDSEGDCMFCGTNVTAWHQPDCGWNRSFSVADRPMGASIELWLSECCPACSEVSCDDDCPNKGFRRNG